MNINTLQKALEIMNYDKKGGHMFGYHDEIQIYPMTDSFTKSQCDELEMLGFHPTEDDEGWMCFT